MHKVGILLCSLISVINLFGQDNFVSGKVTLSNGEVLNGSINDLYWDATPTFFKFRDSNGKVSKFYPQDVLDFEIGEKSIYLSKLVDFDSVYTESKEVINNVMPRLIKKHVFLKVLVKGSKSLLVHTDKDDHFFIEHDDKVESLISHSYKARIGSNTINMENKLYILQLTNIFSDCKSLQVTNKLLYLYKPLVELFLQYASCKGEEVKRFSKKEKTIIRKGLIGTMAYDEMRKGFHGGEGFGAGGFLNIYVPNKVYRYSLYGELAYRMFGDQLWQGIDYAGFPYKETHQVRSIKFTVLNRWHLGKTPGLPYTGYTYVGIGASGSFGLKDLYQRGPYVGQNAAPFFGLIFNSGVYLFKNVAIDVRYERGSSIRYTDLVIQDNRPPQSTGYSSIQGSLIIEF